MTASAMDITFTLKDVIYIVGIIAGLLAQWFTNKMNVNALLIHIQGLEKDMTQHKEVFLSYKASRKGAMMELEQKMENKLDIAKQDYIREVMRVEDSFSKFEDKFDKFTDEMRKFREEMIKRK